MTCESYSSIIISVVAIFLGIYSWNANYILSFIPFHIPFLKPAKISDELAVASSWNKLIANPDARFTNIAVGYVYCQLSGCSNQKPKMILQYHGILTSDA